MSAGLFRLLHGARMKAFDGFPGPTPAFPFGTGLDFAGKIPWEVCARYAKEYGGVTRVWLGGRPALVLNDPGLIGEVLDTRADDFYKDSPRAALLPVITDNCPFIANGADWKAKRENHPFRMDDLHEWTAGQVAPMRAVLRDSLRRLSILPGPVDVGETVQQLGFNAFAAAVWGRTFEPEVYRRFLTLGRTGDRRMKWDLLAPLGPPLSPWFYDARRRWVGLFSSLVAEAGAPGASDGPDLLGVLRGRGRPATDAFRDAMANIFFGGVFSAFSAVTTSLYLLAHHPAAQDRLRAELAGLGEDYGLEALEGCAYLDCVLREALRYESPVPLYFRNTAIDRPVALAGRMIPANTLLFICNRFLHRDPSHWKDSDRFDPARWEGGGAARDPYGSGWFFPFGRGPRTCVGQAFALFAMKLTLAVLVGEARLDLDLSLPYRQDFFFGVMTPGGLRGRFLPPAG